MAVSFKGRRFRKDIILQCVRWYVAYPLSYRQLEEMMLERGVSVDHTTLNRWVLKYSPELEKTFKSFKTPVGTSWCMDETYIKVKGQWKYLYRAVDKEGKTIDFLLTDNRNTSAALAFFNKAIGACGHPKTVTIDKSGSNTAALNALNQDVKNTNSIIAIRQTKYLNNRIEQDHRAIKRKTRPMLGFKTFASAQKTLSGIELMHMLRKGQCKGLDKLTPAQQFYYLAG